jgi:hypothetical protein
MGLKTANKKSDWLDVQDLKQLASSELWEANNPDAMIRKLWFLLTFWFIFRAKESTWELLQGDLSLEQDQGGAWMLLFKDHRLSKTTFATVVTGKLPSRVNQKRQQPRTCYDVELIELYKLYLSRIPEPCRGDNQYFFYIPLKKPTNGLTEVSLIKCVFICF